MSQSVPNVNHRWDDPTAHKGKYPPDWSARRKAVYERDNWTCQSCGHMSGPHAGDEGRSLHSHHVISLSEGGSHKFSNLETLCGVCHNNQHHHDIFASDSGGVSFSQFISDMIRGLAAGALLLIAIAAYGAITIGASVSVVSSATLPVGIIVLGAVATLFGVMFAIVWPRVSGPALALGGIICTGLVGSFPGAQATDPAVALILAMFGIPVLVAAWNHFKG